MLYSVQVSLILLNNGHKGKNSGSGNSDVSKRSHKVLPLSEKVRVLNLIRKEKNCKMKLLSKNGEWDYCI